MGDAVKDYALEIDRLRAKLAEREAEVQMVRDHNVRIISDYESRLNELESQVIAITCISNKHFFRLEEAKRLLKKAGTPGAFAIFMDEVRSFLRKADAATADGDSGR